MRRKVRKGLVTLSRDPRQPVLAALKSGSETMPGRLERARNWGFVCIGVEVPRDAVTRLPLPRDQDLRARTSEPKDFPRGP